MKELNRIATTFKESIFSEISRTANEFQAINLSQGFPNFHAPEWLLELARESVNENHHNQYSPSSGNNGLVHELSEYYKRFYNLDYQTNEITVTAGCTEALYCAATALLNPGDEVLLFEPFYDSYLAISQLAGAKAKFITLEKPEFKINASAIEKNITNKTKVIFLNNPHNPTGRVFSHEELNIIAGLAIKHDLFVISDEVYEHLVFDEKRHTPIATLEGMKERTFTLSSLGKTFGVTGWKIGWACGPEVMTKALRNIHQFNVFCANHPFQFAAAKALQKIDQYIPEFKKIYEDKKNLFVNSLEKSELKIIKPEGTYFAMAELPAGKSDVDFCLELIKEKGVAAIPPSAFYQESNEGSKMLRFCFAKDNDTLNRAIERLI
jgi:aspartate/methionine/tyrosine aminotransferase